jgi:hypothetical protein
MAEDNLLEELRAFGLALPGAHRKSPWPDHDDLAVNDKTFAYLPGTGKPFSLSANSHGLRSATVPYAEPTAYGLGKSGWVSLRPRRMVPSLDRLKAWVEKAGAQAPHKLVKQLDERRLMTSTVGLLESDNGGDGMAEWSIAIGTAATASGHYRDYAARLTTANPLPAD